ncbi:MAG TPA: hypothetical protein VGY66_02215 [Gemmataceae bacterium]|jgi:hypothetical protein|nr:hypothetical protein [Gemmataceae bacterium]
MRIPSRRTFWLTAATLFAAIVVCVWLFVPHSRITRKNGDRIHNYMSLGEVVEILGQDYSTEDHSPDVGQDQFVACYWRSGPNWICITFHNGTVLGKVGYFVTPWEELKWYVKRGAEKIGIKSESGVSAH